jgi:hypothetical protein
MRRLLLLVTVFAAFAALAGAGNASAARSGSHRMSCSGRTATAPASPASRLSVGHLRQSRRALGPAWITAAKASLALGAAWVSTCIVCCSYGIQPVEGWMTRHDCPINWVVHHVPHASRLDEFPVRR